MLGRGDAVMRIPAQMKLTGWGEIVNTVRAFLWSGTEPRIYMDYPILF